METKYSGGLSETWVEKRGGKEGLEKVGERVVACGGGRLLFQIGRSFFVFRFRSNVSCSISFSDSR